MRIKTVYLICLIVYFFFDVMSFLSYVSTKYISLNVQNKWEQLFILSNRKLFFVINKK